jgi:hypothetical protein
MTALRYLLIAAGLALALLAAFIPSSILPWLVGGTGIVVGLLSAKSDKAQSTFWGALGLVVALSAIALQTFNPAWLESSVFFVRVFFAHVLLIVGLCRFLCAKPATAS